MSAPFLTRAAFLDGILTSSFPHEKAKRFAFTDGEVGALYTLGRDPVSGESCPVILLVATFPPSSLHGHLRDFGIDYLEKPVASPAEAQRLLAQFGPAEAAQFRASCRPR